MKSQVTDTTDTNATIVVTLAHDHLEPYVAQAYNHLRGRVKVAGFRPGKAPDNIVERELGSAAVHDEVLEHAIQDSYANAIIEHGLAVIAPPDVKVTKFVPFDELEYTATVDVMPDVKLTDYKKIKVKRPEVKVEDAEIEATIEDLRKRLATKTPADRPAQMGDEVVMDFDGTMDGKPVEGASAKDHTLTLGSNTFIPGFEEELVGLKKGDEKTFDIVFPKDYSAKDLAGQKVTFQVKINEINNLVLPPVDDEFVGNVSPLKTVEELKSDIRLRIQEEKNEAAAAKYEQDVLDEIVAKSTWSAPKRLVQNQLERMKQEMADRLSASGLTLDKYLNLSAKSAEELDKELQPTAEKRVGLALVLNKISGEEGVEITPAEVDAELTRMKAQYTDPQMQAELNKPAVREDVLNHLAASHTIEKILSYIEK